MNNNKVSPDEQIVRQIARRLHADHAKRTSGRVVGWKSSSLEERRIWWSLAKSAVHLVDKARTKSG